MNAIVTPGSLVLARPNIIRVRTFDAATYDQATVDSAGAFLIGELERLDQTLHMPLASVTWSRDIDLREDVSIADETSSFTNSSFAASGGVSPNGKGWIGKDSNSIGSIAIDIGKTANPLFLWGQEISWTIPELESAQRLGRPVDAQKFNALKLKHNMDTDEQVYIGDPLLNVFGLVNSPKVTNVANVAAGAGVGAPTEWDAKTADEILLDVNDILSSTWQESAWAVIPTELRLPPRKYSQLVQRKVSDAGNMSIMEYIRQNNLAKANGQELNIQPLKWLNGRGVGGTAGDDTTTNRMVAYTKDIDRVRFPMTPLQRTPLEYRSLYQLTTYFGRLGVVEIVYPETVGYRDGI